MFDQRAVVGSGAANWYERQDSAAKPTIDSGMSRRTQPTTANPKAV